MVERRERHARIEGCYAIKREGEGGQKTKGKGMLKRRRM